METFQSPSPTAEVKDRSPLFMALLTLALYFSGLFVFLTPLPFVYLIFKRGEVAFYQPVIVAFAMVACVYILGLTFLANLYDKYPGLVWLLPIPSLGLI